MNKRYICLLFCMFLASSSFAMEVPSSSESMVTIIEAKASNMSEAHEILNNNTLNLKKMAVFIDFDDTIATSTITCNNIKFKLLPCPDRSRTYRSVFDSALINYSYNQYTFSITTILQDKTVQKNYEILDEGVKNLSAGLSKNACFFGVCSGLALDDAKKEVLKLIGLDESKYFCATNKADKIYDEVRQLIQDNLITTIVLIDNSKEYAITPFLDRMCKLLINTGMKRPLKVIGIEFTKFENMATQEAIENELELLGTFTGHKKQETGSCSSAEDFFIPTLSVNH